MHAVAEARKAAHEAAHAADAQRQQMRLDEIVGAVIRLCACGAMTLDHDELRNGSHVQPVDGSWICVTDEPTT